MDEDSMTLEEVQEMRAAMWSDDVDTLMASVDVSRRLVAEGDSWFDYPPGLDILVQLHHRHGYRIYPVAQAGDTLENMAFGTEIRRNFMRREPQLSETLAAIRRHRPRIVLLSGGGNDFAGNEFEAYLNHKSSGLPALRIDHLNDVITSSFRRAYEHIVAEIWKLDPSIHIVCHGYANAVPDGRAVLNLPFGFRFVGPWLRPALSRKNITDLREGTDILRQVIDRFNEMLRSMAQPDPRIHYIDLRPLIATDDWANELHLKNTAYGRVADRFHAEIRGILGN